MNVLAVVRGRWLIAVAIMGLVACGEGSSAGRLRVGLITPGSIADAAWNAGAYQGLLQVRDSIGAQISHIEARTPAEQEEALRAYAAQGYDLIFAHGFEFQGAAERVSAKYPKVAIVVTSGERAAGNVAPLIYRLEQASYLAGMVAGGVTRSNIIGFVGGIELPPIEAAYEGWVNGAKAVNPKVDARKIYLNSFDDAAAALMSERPADIAELQQHPDYGLAVPTPDHFLPLCYIAGVAAAAGTAAAPLVRGCTLGSISMTCYGAGTDGVACTQGGAGADVPTGVPPDQTNV